MEINIYSKSGDKIGTIEILGDRIKELQYSVSDYSLESFVVGDGSHRIDVDEEYDTEYTIDKISKHSNQGLSKMTHVLVCDEFASTFYLKLNVFVAIYIKWHTKQLYFRTTLFRREVAMVVTTAILTITFEIFILKIWKWFE